MIGADLTKLDSFTLSLLTNDEVLNVDQKSTNGRELFNRDGFYAWVADVSGSHDKYLAVFNARDTTPENQSLNIPVLLSELGFENSVRVRDLWQKKNLGVVRDKFSPLIKSHGAGLYRLSPQ